MLTGGLLVILAAVAIWSALFQDDRIADDPETPAVETTRADPSNVRAPDVQTTAPDIAAAPEDVTSRQPSGAQTDPSEDLQTPDTPVTDAALPQSADAVNSQNRLDDEALYAVSGIWQAAPTAPLPPEVIELEDLYRVSIDPRDLSQDALALPPAPGYDTDRIVASVATPVAAGTAFALDSRGLVTPSENGTLNPDGILIYRGSPSLVPPETPTRFEADPEEEANIQRDRLAAFRPRPRPGDLVEQNERAQLGGLTRSELGNVRPKLRPKNVKTEAEADETPTAQAIVVSRMPKLRPSGFDKKVQSASRQAPAANAQVAAAPAPAQVAPRTVTPRIPSSASVARRATLDNAINLRRVNLIGVYGTPSNRRALVRLPSGRYKKVKVGDKVDGGRILAIGDSELRYQKGGRNVTLKIPSG